MNRVTAPQDDENPTKKPHIDNKVRTSRETPEGRDVRKFHFAHQFFGLCTKYILYHIVDLHLSLKKYTQVFVNLNYRYEICDTNVENVKFYSQRDNVHCFPC